LSISGSAAGSCFWQIAIKQVKQIAQYQDGRIELQEVPTPTAPPGGVLVRVTHSVISSGTEKMKVAQAKMNLLQKARARPDQVRKVMEVARNLGWRAALQKVRNRLESPSPLGYSAAGVVVAVDPLNMRFRVGDRVACGGAECAFHAEYVATPDLLTARVPEGVPNSQAAYTTLCSIALQSVRQTDPRLGDRVLVLGQGLVGLLITNLLHVSGVRVMAVDLLPSRRPFCEAMGAEKTVILGQQNLPDEVRSWTEGYGVDAAILCTSSESNTPVEQAAEALRDRGRMVVVGITKVELPWRTFSEKEIEVRYSRSYGPGRYDPTYEWGGSDYPIGYVRWTEQRNFEAVLHLMAQGQMRLAALTTRRVPLGETLSVYQTLTTDSKDVGIVIEYPAAAASSGAGSAVPAANRAVTAGSAETEAFPEGAWTMQAGPQLARGAGRIATPVSRVDVIGAGNFARTMLLPHLKEKLAFGAIVNQTALSARHVQTKFGFEKAATDASDLLNNGDPSNAVLIATRHHLHAPFVKTALLRNRHIFVEKPLCLSLDELREIDAAYENSQGTVQVGFNRRFAPASHELKQVLAASPGPKSASFRVNAGKLDPRHWYANHGESGGRVLGEACHFLDYFCFVFGSDPVRVFAQTTWPASGRQPYPDSVAAQIEFADGSTGQLLYSAEGDPKYPKEMFTVYAAGVVCEISNYQELVIHRGRQKKSLSYNSKGHAEQMAAWQSFLRGETDHSFPYAEARRSMLLTFAVLESIQRGGTVPLRKTLSA
jgi:predicted dehydrogenase/threonine dehydrogenase-like Zn-dependent dehydrogenase